jgi:hypothetical protein
MYNTVFLKKHGREPGGLKPARGASNPGSGQSFPVRVQTEIARVGSLIKFGCLHVANREHNRFEPFMFSVRYSYRDPRKA